MSVIDSVKEDARNSLNRAKSENKQRQDAVAGV
jgi:hypothetical protein